MIIQYGLTTKHLALLHIFAGLFVSVYCCADGASVISHEFKAVPMIQSVDSVMDSRSVYRKCLDSIALLNESIIMMERDPSSSHDLLFKHKVYREESFDLVDVLYQKNLLVFAKEDPVAAEQLISQVQHKKDREILLFGLAQGWAKKDVDRAYKWLEETVTLKDLSHDLVHDIYGAIIPVYARKHPERAIEIVKSLESEKLQLSLIGPLLENLVQKDIKQVFELIVDLDSESLRSAGVERIIDTKGYDFEKIWDGVIQSQSKLSTNVIADTYAQMAVKDSAEAAEKLSLVSDRHLPAAGSLVISIWLSKDTPAATVWIFNQNKESLLFETCVETLVNRYAFDEPTVAIGWALKIANPDKKALLISNVVKQSKGAKLEIVKSYLKNLNVSSIQYGE